jgi:N-succinyldiaminopimelate aminotransferase
MNPDLDRLQPYPFEKLAALMQGVTPPATLAPILLSIGEPKHPTPGFISEELITHLHGLSSYPTTRGSDALRGAVGDWLTRRFRLRGIDPARQILPVNGTREALFAFAQCLIDRARNTLVLMPNPFYQIYEGAALLAGAAPYFLNNLDSNGYLPDYDAVPAEVWQRCQLLYLCSPDNPTGTVTPPAVIEKLIRLADEYDFVIAADECYSEIYLDESNPPPGILEVCKRLGRDDYRRCIAFHSLSKRSNAPGLRSGFVAGDADLLDSFLRYRTYHGCAMPPATQAASAAAWRDEAHVVVNRAAYRAKFEAVLDILQPVMEVGTPAAGFYLWPRTPVDDTVFARDLYAQQHVTVLPGVNPGAGRVRMALVAPLEECVEAAGRIRDFIETL